jgi:hypothetical protein
MRPWHPLNHRSLRRQGSCRRFQQPAMTQSPSRNRKPPWADPPTARQIRLNVCSWWPGGARARAPLSSSRCSTCPRIFAINSGSSAQAVKQGRLSAWLKKVPAERRRACPSEAVVRAGNDPQRAATLRTGLDVDCKHPLQSLHSHHWFRSSKAAMGRKRSLDPPHWQ